MTSVQPCFREVSLLDHITLLVRAGCAPAALLTADVDGDPTGDAEIVLGGVDGTISIYKGALNDQPVCVLSGFGPIVAVKYEALQTQGDTGAPEVLPAAAGALSPTPKSSRSLFHAPSPAPVTLSPIPPPARSFHRLLIANGSGDLFVVELNAHAFLEEWRRMEAEAANLEAIELDAEEQREQEQPGAPEVDKSQDYMTSSFVRTHKRFRIPLNATAMEWAAIGPEGRFELVIGTVDRSLHVYALFLARDADELAAEAREAEAALSISTTADRSRDGRSMVASPVLPTPSSRRGSGTAMTGLSALGAPMLGQSILSQSPYSSKGSSPSLRGQGGAPQLPGGGAMAARGESPANLSRRVASPLVGTGPSSNASTRAGSPMLGTPGNIQSSSILSSINAPMATSPLLPKAASPSPIAQPSPTLLKGPRKYTLHHRLELRRQVLHLPLAVSSFSFVSRSSEKAIEMLQREISSNEPPSDPSQPQQIPSNTSGLLPMQIVDSTTLHVLPSIHYQRARAPTTSQHQRGTSTQGGSLSSSSSHNASTASLVNLQSRDTPVLGPTSAGLSVNPSPAGAPRNLRSNMTGLTMPSRKGSGAQPPLGFNSPAQFHSPHLASYSSGPLLSSSSFSQPGSSPKYGPALGFGNASPRFSFLPSMAYPSTSLYSTSVSASPLISATSNQRDRDAPMPNFSLGNSAATVTTMGSESAEVTMLPISEQLLLVSLDQGVLLMDLNHVWTLLLSFPPPPTGPASGLPPSASSASLASAAAGSNPSATPPSRGGSAITSPPRVSLAGSAVGIGGQPVPMMQRTASAPGIAQLEAASRDYLLSPPVPASSLSNSTSSTPSLRPAIGRRQPSGINLNALEQTAPVTVSGFVTPTAGSVTDLPSPSSLKVTLANVPSGSNDGGTPLLSPSGATTPQARSISNSRNASSASLAGMGGAAPVISPTASSFQGPKNVDSVRARVVRVGTEGGMAVLDALGRFTLQMVGKQLQVQEQAGSSSTTSPNTVAVSPQTPKPNWYEYSFHLPGQFMQMLTVPMRGDLREGDVEQTVLLACSWDGSVYFIPILPCICPPMPAADESSASSRATNDYPLILTRFQHPTRIQSFHSALFSIVPSQPAVPCLFFLTFQNELLIYPDAFDAAGLDQWKAEWTWRERQGKMSRSPSEGEISGAQAGAEGTPPVASAGIAIVEPEVASSYELTIRSSKRTVLEAWRESDARLAAALLEAPDSPADQGDMAMAALPTLARVSSSNSTPAAIIATEQSVAPYLRELRSADLAILNAYRDHLKAQLGIPTEPEVAVQTSSVSPPGVVSQILPQSPRDFVGAASPPIVATPTSSPTHRVQGSTGSLTFGASPLFASFKVATTNHFKSPSGEFQRAMEPNAQPVGSWKLEDRMKTVEEQAPSPMSSFWRKLLRRST